MAISWITALKAVPWADVIEATPALVKGARKLLKRSSGSDDGAAAEPAMPSPAPPRSEAEALARLAQLEAALAEQGRRQAESAALLESLAEHNARLVEAVELLRLRSRLLLWACAGLTVGVALLAFWP